ncbi:conserved hypothetical protein [Ricinus communis]|uniref:Uncharacterized protein n=1 Tax=Ricinus communis TaxID=3988 RepID=B9TAP2_RICCO|nr:conserved hypothetical protein [Ricinus communis]
MLLPASDAARDRLSFKPLSFGSDKSSPFGRFAQVRWSSRSVGFPNVKSCSGLRKEHRPSTLNE